jgi:hypothetical protein
MEYELCDPKNPAIIDFTCVHRVLNDIGISNDIIAVILIASIIVIVSVLLYHIISGLPMRR